MSSKKFLCITLVLALMLFVFSGCGGSSHRNSSSLYEQEQEQEQGQQQQTQSQDQKGTSDYDYSSTTAGENAILADGEDETYSDITVYKSGSYSGSEEADFYGTNAAILAMNGATLILSGITVTTEGSYANGVFCYGGSSSSNNNGGGGNGNGGTPPAMPGRISATGDGSTVNISNSTITTSSNNSGGIMTTGGGVMNATNLTITTSGGSSAAIRSDRGGGTVTVNQGTYTTSGTGSPAIYSTADISVSNATLESKAAQGVVIEGSNSVALTDCKLTANHSKLNGQDSSYQGVMIYQSGSGDASSGTGTFTMSGGSLTNSQGSVFFVTNTTAIINLSNTTITNNDSNNIFLNAASAAWGTSGSNGGDVTLTASGQTINGSMTIDANSGLTLNLEDSSTMTGAINSANSGAEIDVTVESGSTWTLTGNSYVTSLNNNGTINTGAYTLYVNGTAY